MKYSIIVPVYNTNKYLHECLNSILQVERSDIEVIAIDDGSTDSSWEILKKWKKKDSRLKIYTQENAGVSAARNKGITEASGEWILFVDSDDYILEGLFNRLDQMIELYSEADCIRFVDNSIKDVLDCTINKQQRQDLILSSLGVSREPFIVKNLASVCMEVVKRNILIINDIKFNKRLIMGEDLMFNLDLILHINKILFVPENYYFYRVNFASASKGINNKVPERDLIFQEELSNLITKNNLEKELSKGSLHCALNGILISCNSCFFRYDYKQYKRKLEQFLSEKIYSDALKNIRSATELKWHKKIMLLSMRYRIFFWQYFMKKIYFLMQRYR